ncbi:hypothetical protein PISL3812_00559 [Talaromyces islandicus]|uniref:YAG7-like dimerisation domain-containing protein n=1 Tax=Talaromyces islandicus TaxID=28573 RepID=A0A0U1LJN0_TALIS|nr:hypothetical protein PISL3812_00559 [Talaromyces islandicus]
MSAVPVNGNPPKQANSSKKKRAKAKAEASTNASESTPSIPDDSKPEPSVNGVSDEVEGTLFKELQRNLRNASKKLGATAKVDSIIAQHPGKSLDELVAEKKINADQKAQALKKPALQAQVTQIEEQIAQYKQFASHYEERLVSQKAALETAHKEEIEAIQQKAAAEAKESREAKLRSQLLTLSQFLRTAASFRHGAEEASADSPAFEGVLLQIYGGTKDAVDSMIKLIDGSDEKVVGVDDQLLDVSYARVKQVAEERSPPVPETTWTEGAQAEASSDPTISNAGLTELQDTTVSATVDDKSFAPSAPAQSDEPVAAPPAQGLVGDAANQVAESNWEPQTASWAEDVPSGPTPTAGNDGFEQVVHHQRQNSVRAGRGRSRGRGDGSRGRGGRGEFKGRGRGRGEFKGGRGRGGLGGQQGNRGEAVATN